MRRAYAAKKRDGNEKPIVDALRAVGATVERMDFVDLLVGYQGQNHLLEVKTEKGLKRNGPNDRKTRERQEKFRKAWQGTVHVVTDAAQALYVIGCPAWEKLGVESAARRTG